MLKEPSGVLTVKYGFFLQVGRANSSVSPLNCPPLALAQAARILAGAEMTVAFGSITTRSALTPEGDNK